MGGTQESKGEDRRGAASEADPRKGTFKQYYDKWDKFNPDEARGRARSRACVRASLARAAPPHTGARVNAFAPVAAGGGVG